MVFIVVFVRVVGKDLMFYGVGVGAGIGVVIFRIFLCCLIFFLGNCLLRISR